MQDVATSYWLQTMIRDDEGGFIATTTTTTLYNNGERLEIAKFLYIKIPWKLKLKMTVP